MVEKFRSSHLLLLKPASNRAQQFLFTLRPQLFTQAAVFALAMSSYHLGNQKDLIPGTKYIYPETGVWSPNPESEEHLIDHGSISGTASFLEFLSATKNQTHFEQSS